MKNRMKINEMNISNERKIRLLILRSACWGEISQSEADLLINTIEQLNMPSQKKEILLKTLIYVMDEDYKAQHRGGHIDY